MLRIASTTALSAGVCGLFFTTGVLQGSMVLNVVQDNQVRIGMDTVMAEGRMQARNPNASNNNLRKVYLGFELPHRAPGEFFDSAVLQVQLQQGIPVQVAIPAGQGPYNTILGVWVRTEPMTSLDWSGSTITGRLSPTPGAPSLTGGFTENDMFDPATTVLAGTYVWERTDADAVGTFMASGGTLLQIPLNSAALDALSHPDNGVATIMLGVWAEDGRDALRPWFVQTTTTMFGTNSDPDAVLTPAKLTVTVIPEPSALAWLGLGGLGLLMRRRSA